MLRCREGQQRLVQSFGFGRDASLEMVAGVAYDGVGEFMVPEIERALVGVAVFD